MMTITIYGIKNCDTMKKARAWLDDAGVSYVFHDYKIDGIDRVRLAAWCKAVGWETLLNRSGTTFRKLPEADKQNLDEAKAIALMLAQPSIIKRPVRAWGLQFHIECDAAMIAGWTVGDQVLLDELGFDPDVVVGAVAEILADVEEVWQPFAARFAALALGTLPGADIPVPGNIRPLPLLGQ